MSFITTVLPTLLRITKVFLDNKVKDAEAKEMFLKFVSRLQNLGFISAELFKEDMKQKQELEQQFEDYHKGGVDE